MIEGLISVLILSFVTVVFGIILDKMQVVIPQALLICVIIYLLVRVRVKISKAEKENLRAKIEELEKKIASLGQKEQ